MNNLIDITLAAGQLEGTTATLATWLVKIGDSVQQGDPLAELETDKVVMEVCAAQGGKIASLSINVGDDVATEQLLGQIETAPAASARVATARENSAHPGSAKPSSANSLTQAESALETNARHRISPAVRRLLRQNALSIENISGTGKRGRVSKDDVIAYLKNPPLFSAQTQADAQPVARRLLDPLSALDVRQSRPLEGKRIKHTKMRQSIASHMVESLLHTSPHVTSVFEMDLSNLIEHRKWHKKEFAQLGVKLTFTSYFLAAMAKAVKLVPQSNARFHPDALEIFDDVNIGVGTALGDAGLVVPVVEQVQQMNLFEISQRLNAQTEKARSGKLTPADMSKGTITISNHGVSGSLFATPIIINQPQVAILGVGKLEKRVVVEQVNGIDTMVIRPKCYVSLSIDHRALDAHQTNLFLSEFVNQIENWGV